MVEQGLVALIQGGLGTPPIAPGGWLVMLPENQISNSAPMAWVCRSLTAPPTYVLEGQDPLTDWNIAIDCHGFTMAYAIQLARAIDGVLTPASSRGLRAAYTGVLPDPDHTFVHGIFRQAPFIDGFSDLTRAYVRTLEYKIQYDQI